LYYVRVSAANTNLWGPGSEYELRIYVPIGGSGGVITILPIPPGPGIDIGSFSVYLGPPQALAAGAGWQIPELMTNYLSDNDAVYALPIITNWSLSFSEIPGFQKPASRPLHLVTNGTTTAMAYYTSTNTSPVATGLLNTTDNFYMTFMARYGTQHAVEHSTNLVDWIPMVTNQVPQDGLLHFVRTNTASDRRGFFRTRSVP
jgi:hypothetical protein